jgi:EXPERA (EXPanded EBP superfamily)
MRALQGATRRAFLGFFASHIIFTVVMDGQAIDGAKQYPVMLQDFHAWYVAKFNDPLMGGIPLWFQCFVVAELCLQLPYFFVACYFLSSTTLSHYPSWFRSSCIAYGAHTATIMIPILTTLASNANATDLERYVILAIYLPYLIFPLWILSIAANDADTQVPSKKGKTG